jgi:hypothetical protein
VNKFQEGKYKCHNRLSINYEVCIVEMTALTRKKAFKIDEIGKQ